MKLLGKTVLITGSARRIGREIALRLARSGASLVLHYNRSKKEATELQSELTKAGTQSFLVQGNFGIKGSFMDAAVRKFTQQVYEAVPHIDVLINNAAIFYPTPLGKITDKEWDEVMTVNLKAPFFMAQAFGQAMLKRQSGKIINLVDWTADRPSERFIPYAISKAGLIAATQGLARAFAPHVQVLGIAPGPILPAESTSKEEQEKAAERSLVKHYGNPQDIAETVRFLIEGTDFMTGSIVYVDGGASLA